MTQLVKGMLAGALIAMSCVVYTRIGAPYGAFLFSLGLLAICHNRLPLYTGRVGAETKISVLAGIWLYNLMGAALVYLLLYIGGYDLSVAAEVAADKFSRAPLLSFILSIFCGVLMQLAVSAYEKRPVITILCVMVFLICGFEHSVANMFWALNLREGIAFAALFVLMHTAGNAIGAKAVYFVQKKEL